MSGHLRQSLSVKSTKRRRTKQSLQRQCRAKFLRAFPGGFRDETFLEWERNYKTGAHQRWIELLGNGEMENLFADGNFNEIAARAIRVESRTNLLFSFEKIAIRDAVRIPEGAERFARGLIDFINGADSIENRFKSWSTAIAALPRKQTRVITWPVLTVFPFLADPKKYIFLKPKVTKAAAVAYGFEFNYKSPPSWDTYRSFLNFAQTVRTDLSDLKPRDMIDIQSFIWVQGSEEY